MQIRRESGWIKKEILGPKYSGRKRLCLAYGSQGLPNQKLKANGHACAFAGRSISV